MTNEVKEILDRLERIDHKEYSGGFEFANSSTFNEMCRCYEERKKMADYITNLQQELEIMVKDDERSQETIIKLSKENERLKEAQKNFEKQFIKEMDYKSRIEKALLIIEKQKKKMYKSRNKIAMFILIKLDNILNGRSDE